MLEVVGRVVDLLDLVAVLLELVGIDLEVLGLDHLARLGVVGRASSMVSTIRWARLQRDDVAEDEEVAALAVHVDARVAGGAGLLLVGDRRASSTRP